MSEYRDELAAAHARIAELEEKIRVLEDEARPKAAIPDGRFPELEAEIERLRPQADAQKNAQLRTRVSYLGAMFPLAGMVFTYFHLPLAATACSVFFIALLAYNFALAQHLKTSTRKLTELETKLADRRRIAELEGELATKVRVVPSGPIDGSLVEEEDDDALRLAHRG